jgi:hypothetical protein
VLDQAQPGRLHHVAGIGRSQPVGPRDGPEQGGVARDDQVPCLLIAIRRGADDAGDVAV